MESDAERLIAVGSVYPWYSVSLDHVSTETQPTLSPVVDRRSSAARNSRWPWFLWFVIKFIGLFNRRPAVTKIRRCMQCRLAAAERRCVIRGEGVPGYLYLGALVSEDEGEGLAGEDEMSPSIGWHDSNENRVTTNGEIGSGAVELRIQMRNKPPCEICCSEWWDANGMYRPYDNQEIGIQKWNHLGSTFLSVFWQALLVLLNLIQFLFYFTKYWGQADRVVDLVIYSGFVIFVASIPTLCVIANILNMMSSWRKKAGRYSWFSALDIRYIVKRLQHLELREHGLPYKAFLVVCLGWPIINSVWRMHEYYENLQKHMQEIPINTSHAYNISVENVIVNPHYITRVPIVVMMISLAVCSISMSIWGAFCYLVAVMRLSFQRQLETELAFLRKHANDLDRCRRRLTSCMEAFGSLASLTTMWIMFTIAITAWAITTQVYFDYTVGEKFENKTCISNKEINPGVVNPGVVHPGVVHRGVVHPAGVVHHGVVNTGVVHHGVVNHDGKFATTTNLDALIWSQIAMFVLLPLVAVGGLNLNGLWVRFTRAISDMRLGKVSLDAFCDDILAYCTEQPPVQNIETVTLFVSALGLCLAVMFNERDEFGL